MLSGTTQIVQDLLFVKVRGICILALAYKFYDRGMPR